MKILLTSDWYKPAVNGVVASLLNLEKGLSERGHDVRILTLSESVHTHKEGNVYFIGAIPAGLVYPGARVRYALAHPLVRELMDWHPDVVHSNCEMSTFLIARKISKHLGVPLVHTYHTVYEDYTHYFSPSKRVGKALVRKFSRVVANRTSAFIVPSVKVKKLLETYDISAPLYVIPTGIDQTKFGKGVKLTDKDKIKQDLGIEKDDKVIIYIGRLAKEKNVAEIIDNMKSFYDSYASSKSDLPKVKFLIVGDGPSIKELKEQAAECDLLGNKVIFYGAVSPAEVGKYYHLGDLFVSASNSETQGLTYFEALSSGLPILCKADDCLEGVVDQGVNGWQYNSDDEFRRYVTDYLALPDGGKAMQDAALSAGEKFSVPKFAESAEEVYHEALANYYKRPMKKRNSRVRVTAKVTFRRLKKSGLAKVAIKGASVAKAGAGKSVSVARSGVKKGANVARRAVKKIRSIRFLP